MPARPGWSRRASAVIISLALSGGACAAPRYFTSTSAWNASIPSTAKYQRSRRCANFVAGLDTWDSTNAYTHPFYAAKSTDPQQPLLYNSSAWYNVFIGKWARTGNSARDRKRNSVLFEVLLSLCRERLFVDIRHILGSAIVLQQAGQLPLCRGFFLLYSNMAPGAWLRRSPSCPSTEREDCRDIFHHRLEYRAGRRADLFRHGSVEFGRWMAKWKYSVNVADLRRSNLGRRDYERHHSRDRNYRPAEAPDGEDRLSRLRLRPRRHNRLNHPIPALFPWAAVSRCHHRFRSLR